MTAFDVQRFARAVQQSTRDVRDRMQTLLKDPPAERALRIARETVQEIGPALLRSAAAATDRFFAELHDAMPGNWQRLTHPQIFDTVDLMAGTGWSLVWTPPAETVAAILDAPDPESRRAVLLGAETTIVTDLDDLLNRIDNESLKGLRAAAQESLEAYRSGYFKASQALTTSTLSTTVHEQLREKSHSKVRQKFLDADKQEAEIRDFRWIAIQRALAKVLEDYHPVTGQPERSDYNRNASAHRVKEPQYRQVNALSGLMLLVALLVELDDLADLEQQNPAVPEPAG
jgi:hypothetical protein